MLNKVAVFSLLRLCFLCTVGKSTSYAMPKRKAKDGQATDACPRKALRRMLSSRSEEVLAQVFTFLGRIDIGKARQACRAWRDVVNARETELCLMRCYALDLLPVNGLGVLKTLTDKTHIEAAVVMVADGTGKRARLAAVYREHYM